MNLCRSFLWLLGILWILCHATPAFSEGKFAIVIDDLAAHGYRFDERIAPLLVLNERNVPISYAIMPNLPTTRAVGKALTERGIPYLIHFPMEAVQVRRKPKEKRLAVNMEASEVRELLNEALDQLPEAVGLNNHQGSLCTANYDWMAEFLMEMNRLGLNFLDSGTVPGGERCLGADGRRILASELCEANGICPNIEVVSQNLWLDHDVPYNGEFPWVPSKANPSTPDIKATCDLLLSQHGKEVRNVENRLQNGCDRSKKGERVIAIGHPKWPTICGLRRFFYSEKNQRECPVTSIQDFFH